MDEMHGNMEENNLNKQRKYWLFFHGLVADMPCNKKFNQVLSELFIRAIKLNISLVLITQC